MASSTITVHVPRWRVRAARVAVWLLARTPGVARITTAQQIAEPLANWIVAGARVR